MLETINFSSADTLYVLGDVLDRGPHPEKILADLRRRPNAVLLLGNHERMALAVLEDLLSDDPNLCAAPDRVEHWFRNGGEETLRVFRELPPTEQADLIAYLKNLPPYRIVSLNGKTFVLVHAGLRPCKTTEEIAQIPVHDLCWFRPDPEIPVFEDPSVYTVFGHTPTVYYRGRYEILQRSRNICIDCGAAFSGGKLACLRLDDLTEFYVWPR